jgi:hypothetical protein
VDEFVIQCAQSLRAYEWNGLSYVQVQNIPENFGSILHGVFSHDGNYNGYDEVFWLGIGDGGYWTNATILLEDAASGQTPNVDITLQWLGWMAGGFNYNVSLANGEATPETFDAWIMVQLPNFSWYGPVLGPVNLTLPAGGAITRVRSQVVPGTAPPGVYWYVGYIGDYPSAIWDSSGFNFTISGSEDRGLASGVWENTGEDFGPASCEGAQPCAPTLHSPVPNPFNPSTAISFQLSADSHVVLRVFDISGRLVVTLVDGWREAGTHEVTFDPKGAGGSGLAAGVYVYRLMAGEFTASGKLVLLK